MKTKLLLSALLSFSFCLLSSQVPQGFNYQALALDGNSNAIKNYSTLQVKISILSDTLTPVIVWEELHNPVKTNGFGVFNLVIGDGVRQSGSALTFSDIDWTKTPLYLRTQIFYTSSWKTMGSAQLWSVPYSMIAGDLGGSIKKLKVVGNETSMDSALFEVRNKTGQIVFAVYNEGVRIYVDDGVAKGATKGGFAIGSFDKSKGTSQTLFVVDPDSIRAYIDTGLVKSRKGGFAIGSFDKSKAGSQQFFQVTQDSIRMYINDSPSKAVKGGFAIGGFDKSKGPSTQYLRVTHDSTRIITADTLKGFGVSNLLSGNTLGYLRLTPSNYFIGHQAGRSITTGLYNSVLGYQAGYSLASGISNSLLGYQAGYSNTTGNYNVFIGNSAGYKNNGGMNTFVGYISGKNNTTGYYNSFFGDSTGFSNSTGNNNTFLGGRTGFSNTEGYFNTFVGSMAGYKNTTGIYNTANGVYALYSNTTGWVNTAFGCQALESNTTGGWNTAIGWTALYKNTTGEVNTAIGDMALYTNTTGGYNTAIGYGALESNITGNSNVGVGYLALESNTTGTFNAAFSDGLSQNETGSYNIAIGFGALGSNITGNYNTALGFFADVASGNLNNAAAIGYNAKVTASNTVVFGNSSVVGWGFGGDAGSYAIKVGSNTTNGNGAKLTLTGVWTNGSDISKKYDIDNINYGLLEVLALHPVTFKWKGTNNQDIGFIAQEVRNVIPEIIYGEEGDMTMSYGQLTSVLVKAVQEQQQQIESQKQENQQLRSELGELKTLVNTLVANQAGQGNK